jgi:hypothetical protein
MSAVPDISGTLASGSAEFSRTQLQNMLATVKSPLTVVDLRQESHGFLALTQPLNGETEIAVAWFAERDWINVAKGLPSIKADEDNRLSAAAKTSGLTVYAVNTKTAEDGICTATANSVNPAGSYLTEHGLLKTLDIGYLRLPSTDHCRPRDSEVDRFVAFETAVDPNMWLHFHCRAGDGRTTTFMAMHDIFHNAPGDSLSTILTRQGPKPNGLGGVDLSTPSGDTDTFDYPFSVERVAFMQNFYAYIVEAQPNGFALQWSDWVTQNR